MKLIFGLFKFVFYSVLAVVLLLVGVNYWMINSTKDQVYFSVDTVPQKKVALILGTSKRTKYFEERIATAAKLYHAGKVSHIIVSGDNRTKYYNEPRDMYNALVALDVPKGAITLDFAGLRTLDSIVRAHEVFEQSNFTIITQDFHCYRALFIANFFGFDTIAFAADNKAELPTNLAIREILARFGAVLDLFVFNKYGSAISDAEQLDF